MKLDYFAWPRTLLDDSDEPEFREADHDAIVLYGVYDGLMKRWDVARAMELFNRFVDAWQVGRARSGVREQQARYFQRPNTPRAPFRSGLSR